MNDLFDKEYRTSALDIIRRYKVDLTGKTALITGCTTGIGVDTARALAAAHCSAVYISGRNETALHAVRDQLNAELRQAGQAESVKAILCDLSDLASVRAVAEEFRRQSSELHILILNAGLMAISYRLSPTGADMQFAVNHIGHFLLFQLLLPLLLHSQPSRVIAVSSVAHTMGPPRIDYSRLPSIPASRYKNWAAYQQSKLANILFALEVHRRYASQGVTAYSLHPGGIKTDLYDEVSRPIMFFIWLFGSGMKTVAQGAATTVYCAAAPGVEATSGEYFSNCHVTDGVKKLKLPEDESRKLWEWTEKFIAEH